MTVTLASNLPSYQAWHPSQQQLIEPDTTWLMDLGIEAGIAVADGGIIGANETSGLTADRPPWRGGSHTVIAPGKYRSGIQAADTGINSALVLPSTGLLRPDQWTIEFFAVSTVAWSSFGATAVQIFSKYDDYNQNVTLLLYNGNVQVRFSQHQDPSVFVNAVGNYPVTVGAGVWKSVALSYQAPNLSLVVDEVVLGTLAGCLAPAFWGDNATPNNGIIIGAPGVPQITVSDIRVSQLARTVGVVPGP